LEEKLKADGLASNLETIRKTRDLRFTFLRDKAETADAERDLAEVLDKMTAGASFEAAIQQAFRRAGSTDPEIWQEAFQELERLYSLRRKSEDELRKFSWREADAREDA